MDSYRKNVIGYFMFLKGLGFEVLEKTDDNIVSFQGKHNRLDVEFYPIGYEIECLFVDNNNKSFWLQDGLNYIGLDEYKGMYQVANQQEIIKGVIYLARAVSILFSAVDIREQNNFNKIYLSAIANQDKLQSDYYIETDLKRADSFWDKKEYNKAQELYEKHESSLTKSQQLKLKYIKKHI